MEEGRSALRETAPPLAPLAAPLKSAGQQPSGALDVASYYSTEGQARQQGSLRWVTPAGAGRMGACVQRRLHIHVQRACWPRWAAHLAVATAITTCSVLRMLVHQLLHCYTATDAQPSPSPAPACPAAAGLWLPSLPASQASFPSAAASPPPPSSPSPASACSWPRGAQSPLATRRR